MAGLPDRRARRRGRPARQGRARPSSNRSTSWSRRGSSIRRRETPRSSASPSPSDLVRPGRLRSGHRGGHRETSSSRTSSGARSIAVCPAGDDLRLQHLQPFDRRHGGGHRPARPVRRPPLLQSGAAHAAGRGGPGRGDVRRDLRARHDLRPAARQGADRGAGPLGLRREPPAGALSARRGARTGARRRRPPPTSTAACSSAAATRWARSRCSTSWASTPSFGSRRSCSRSIREPRFAPPPLLRRMVAAGLHGRKSGRGFYDYSTDPPTPIDLGL